VQGTNDAGSANQSITDHELAIQAEDYADWSQVSGYFDGDGSVHLRMDSPVVLRFGLVWVDNSFEQLAQLRRFLLSKRIRVGSVLNSGKGVFRLQVVSPRSVLAAAKAMAPYCFKKSKELRTVIDYYDSAITGAEAIAEINSAVIRGVRTGKIRAEGEFTTYGKAKHEAAVERGRRSAESRKNKRVAESKA
jgi:hypothetical protein